MKSSDSEIQGRSTGLIFLLFPIFCLSWAFYEKVKMPLDQLQFFKYSFFLSVVSYSVIWLLTFLGKRWTLTTWLITGFTFFAWFLGVLLCGALINRKYDSTDHFTSYRLIVRKHQSSGSSGKSSSAPSCTVWFQRPIQNSEYGPLKYGECDMVTVNSDGVMYKMRSGRLGFIWIVDQSVIKDYQTYMHRLQLAEDPI